jgi:hypothetical protein
MGVHDIPYIAKQNLISLCWLNAGVGRTDRHNPKLCQKTRHNSVIHVKEKEVIGPGKLTSLPC